MPPGRRPGEPRSGGGQPSSEEGGLAVQLDKEPYLDQVDLKKADLVAALADFVATESQTRSLLAQIQADRFQLERAIVDVHTQVANLRANIATLKSRPATLELARNNRRRGEELVPNGGISKELVGTPSFPHVSP